MARRTFGRRMKRKEMIRSKMEQPIWLAKTLVVGISWCCLRLAEI